MNTDFMSGFLYCFWVMIVVVLFIVFLYIPDCLHKWTKWEQHDNLQSRNCLKCNYFEVENIVIKDKNT
jgi:hypothetical protein